MNANMSTHMPFRVQDYRTLSVLGEGVFGKVLHCFKPDLPEAVAVKMMKDNSEDNFRAELHMLHHVRALNPDSFNIVKFMDSFIWESDKCLVFEMLDMSLWDLMVKRRALGLCEIRLIAKQLLVAFDGLKQLGVVHTDLKLDNVMLVNQKLRPWKLKLIDFGLACQSYRMRQGIQVQPKAYRAPEVSLGLPLTEALDMWSLGCVLVNLYLGVHPFCWTPYENQRSIIEVLGCIPNDLLNQGMYTHMYYTLQENGQWRLKTPHEFNRGTGIEALNGPSPLHGDSLETAIYSTPYTRQNPEFTDRMEFLNLCKSLLHPDFRTRMTPREAMNHPFITLRSLRDEQSEYARKAQVMMTLIEDTTSVPENHHEYDTVQVLGNRMFQCVKAPASEIVALKGTLWDEETFSRKVAMLQRVRQLDPDKHNIVKFIDTYVQNNCRYLAFEMLDVSLDDMMAKRGTLKLSEIRPIAQQLLVAFNGLKELGVVHTNLKLDKVMLVNQKLQPWRVKLTDFGLAVPKSDLIQGMEVQPQAFRAPEVSLGLPLSEAIDMWSLGCLLVRLYLGVHPFSDGTFENQRSIIDALGFPSNQILSRGVFTDKFYTLNEGQWRLKTPEEIHDETGEQPHNIPGPLRGLDLDEAVLSSPNTNQDPEFRDRLTFLSLCECLLNLDSEKRLTPGAALFHPFITLEHLEENQSEYVNMARDMMTMVNSYSSGPQEPAAEGEKNKTAQTQCDPESQNREMDMPEVVHIQHQEEQNPCDTEKEGNISKTNDPVWLTQMTSTTNSGFVVIVIEEENATDDPGLKKEVSKTENELEYVYVVDNNQEVSSENKNGLINSQEESSSLSSHVRNGLRSMANYILGTFDRRGSHCPSRSWEP